MSTVTPVSVREACFDVVRRLGMTTWFGNPGSTEIPLVSDLPDDIHYVLALHESAAVGVAAGYALASGKPALVSLHTTAGLGNAVNALATARANRAPLVVLVGQQDRRHLLAEPFLTGRLAGLAGDYPLGVFEPPRAQDVPDCTAQAYHLAVVGKGPVMVIVPMDDWDATMDTTLSSATRQVVAAGVDPAQLIEIATMLDAATNPVLVTGSGCDDHDTWAALSRLADRLDCPVFHEPFTARAGYPQHDRRFAGFLPAGREALRGRLAPFDMVLTFGAAFLRQYHFEPGPLLNPGTRAVVISVDAAEVRRSPVDVGVVGDPAAVARELANMVGQRTAPSPVNGAEISLRRRELRDEHGLTPEGLFTALSDRLEADTVVVEESPSSRDSLQLMVPAQQPLSFLSAAMGGLGFGIPAAIGVRMASPSRPVVAVIGDGSSIYCIQALWSAAQYDVGLIIFIMGNGAYQVMDNLTARRGKAPWPGLVGIDLEGLARAFGCEAARVDSRGDLDALLDKELPGLRERRAPLVVRIGLDTLGISR